MERNQKNMRACPICGSIQQELLFVQRFVNNLSHEIVSCKNCGFVFVRNTQSQKEYNRYYKEMSCYEEERDHGFHSKYVEILSKNVIKSSKIIDVGCSTGHLLFLLKKSGFNNVYGIDPSPRCKTITKKKYNINIDTLNLFSLKANKKYDCVILAAVLEHIGDLKKAITVVNSILAENGKVFISVPDAENFYKDFEEPFGEFSIEHINFFSYAFLDKLMIGYVNIYSESDGKALYALWSRNKKLEENVKKYVSVSGKKLSKLRTVIDKAPEKLIVWGAGSLTRRLLETTNLKPKVVRFVDRNKNLIGKKIEGKEVISPERIGQYSEPILISSFKFKDEIFRYIKKQKMKNNVITLK